MPPVPLLPLVALFVSVALATGAAALYFLRRFNPVERRLRDLAEPTATTAPALTELDLSKASYGSLEKFAKYVPKSPRELSGLSRRLAAAGFERPEAAILYGAIELLLPVVFGGTALLLIPPPRGIFIGLVAAVLGYMLPGLWLGQRMTVRRRQIQNGLPDALDLLLVSIEAGSGLDQAMLKVSSELRVAYPVLAGELRQVITEIRAGRPRADALRQFAERSKVDDVRSLAMTLIQTDKFGTSIGQALRTHAEVARTKRRQRAEERAQKLGVKLVFPLVFCLFPAMYVVVLGPSVLRIIHILGSQLSR